MANTKSAEKRIRQAAVRRDNNRADRSRMRNAVKELRAKITEGDSEAAQKLLLPTLSLVDRTAQKNATHRNAAARTKGRLTKAVDRISS